MKICVVMPVYNEKRWVRESVDRVLSNPPHRIGKGRETDALASRELILVDDGSTDGTPDIVRELGKLPGVVTLFHGANRGKGAALRTGIEEAVRRDADIVLIHDADLEYDPADHDDVLRPLLDGRADAVIGSRFLGHTHRVLYYWHSVANKVITLYSNMLTNLNLTDIECCTKAFTGPVAQRLVLTEDRFGIEPELIAKLAKLRLPMNDKDTPDRALRVYEVPVSYAGRTYAEGKKITWKDGIDAILAITKHALG